jgi:hypothetical protein
MSLYRLSRAWTRPAAAGLLAVAVLASARPASANCVEPEQGLLWSYPANGAVDVPLDADLLVTGQADGLPMLDGTPLTRITPGVYDLGELAPDTAYEVRWSTAAIAFTTGRLTNQAGVPDPRLHLSRNPVDAGRCPLVEPQGCFDTGPPTRIRWDVDAFALAWLVDVRECDGSTRPLLWPGACGAPVIERDDRIVCASLRASNGTTLSDATELLCSLPEGSLDTIPRGSDCVGAWPPAGAVTFAGDTDGSFAGDIEGVGSSEAAGARDSEATGAPLSSADEGGCAFIASSRQGGSTAWLAAATALGLLCLRGPRRQRTPGPGAARYVRGSATSASSRGPASYRTRSIA